MALPVALIACVIALGQLAARAHADDAATLHLLDAHNRVLDPEHAALGISRRITHDRSLPREAAPGAESADPENFRITLVDARERRAVVHAYVESVGPDGRRHGLLRHVALARVADSAQFRSAFLRLVSDTTDSSAPDVGLQLLRAELRDRVRAVVPRDDGALAVTLPVGRLAGYDEARSPLRGTLQVTVLRNGERGPPAIGDDTTQAIALARRQVEIANEIWAQCFIDFGDPGQARVRLVDPPPPALLAVADLDGLPTRGVARIGFRANGRRIGPVRVEAASSPDRTASAIARALRRSGLRAEVTINPRTELGAGESADVVVRDLDGQLVRLTRDGDQPLSTDPQQTVTIGVVDLADGLDEFDNTLAVTGTLEERTLVKLLADADPTTIDVFVINRFVNRARQGEAFIEADGSSMANTLIFDRNAVRFERQAWVQAHELGHVLLDEPFHPDNLGPDRPWLLMDADARQGRVTGPKRISDRECQRARRRSGPTAHPPLLRLVEPLR